MSKNLLLSSKCTNLALPYSPPYKYFLPKSCRNLSKIYFPLVENSLFRQLKCAQPFTQFFSKMYHARPTLYFSRSVKNQFSTGQNQTKNSNKVCFSLALSSQTVVNNVSLSISIPHFRLNIRSNTHTDRASKNKKKCDFISISIQIAFVSFTLDFGRFIDLPWFFLYPEGIRPSAKYERAREIKKQKRKERGTGGWLHFSFSNIQQKIIIIFSPFNAA